LNSHNEWDQLKKVFVGIADYAHWPVNCPEFRKLEQTTGWTETPVPSGYVPKKIVEEANHDLDVLAQTLMDENIEVVRPLTVDYGKFDGMYGYCPRDRVLVIGDKAIDAPMLYPTRRNEIYTLDDHLGGFENQIKCNDPEAMFDAANICRLGNDLLYLVSDSGNVKGAEWLQKTLGNKYKVHILDNIYSGVHIDSTISPIREGLVVLNKDRITEDNVPAPLKNWDKIWIGKDDLAEQGFTKYPYASNYIGLNFLTLNHHKIVCDPKQRVLIDKLSKHNVSCIGVDLRHSRTLGGGHHCVTLDLVRENVG
tara:strand:+ start:1378 stop:2304 length:927 start_codon:yes stop_codon:yes gene_type:complete